MRKYYIDNLRWAAILILIPYHVAMAWNTWSEPNYIFFEGNRVYSSFIVFFSAFLMPLLFLIAGMSTRFALSRRTPRQYLSERVKRLLIPLFFGTLMFMPVLTYLADCYHQNYDGSFLAHYSVFFTKYTDLTGADGGFSFGQFWFLLYLFVISLVSLGVILVIRKLSFGKDVSERKKNLPLWAVLCMGIPLPIFSEVLSIGGKSLMEFTYLFLLGYYVFSREEVVEKLQKHCAWILGVGVLCGALNVYLFIWSGKDLAFANTCMKFLAEWFTILGLLGFGKANFDLQNKITAYFSSRSFAIFSLHYLFVVLTQYFLSKPLRGQTILLFFVPVVLSYILSLAAAELVVRSRVLAFVMGGKRRDNCAIVTCTQRIL